MQMNLPRKHIVILDGISFQGGSKIATKNIVKQLIPQGLDVHVLTRDPASWNSHGIVVHSFRELRWLETQEHGIAYFLKHLWISVYLLALVIRCGRGTSLLGASGPGVDLAIYFVGLLSFCPIIQMVHGPVSKSNTIGRCFLIADLVVFLPSALESIKNALGTRLPPSAIEAEISSPTYVAMNNGLSDEAWPSPSTSNFKTAHVFWAASLLRWKGVSVLSSALSRFNQHRVPQTTLCYINPKSVSHEISQLPLHIFRLHRYENPTNLDELRSACNIFVSTSQKEPFGLSILEAMAAGLCIVIPNDGAYWDEVLEDGVNCVKYRAQDSVDLYLKLSLLQKEPAIAQRLAKKSIEVAKDYRAEETYKPIVSHISNLIKNRSAAKFTSARKYG